MLRSSRESVSGRWVLLVVAALAALLVPAAVPHGAGGMTTVQAAVETMLVAFSVLATGLLLLQFSRHHRLADLLLAAAGATMALMNLAVIAAPAILDLRPSGQFATAGVWGGLFSGCALAAAAWTPPGRVVTYVRHPVRLALVAGLLLTAIAEVAGLILQADLVAATTRDTLTATDTFGHGLTFVLVAGSLTAFVVAAIGFTRQRADRGAVFSDLLTAAALVRAAASSSLFLVQSVPFGHASPNAELRTMAIVLILAAAVNRELGERRVLTRAIALAERRRVARDLHDGLAQDLALIAAHVPHIAEALGREHPVAVAARNALAISRGTISELSDPAGASTDESLEAVAQELRERFDVEIVVNTQLDSELSRPARETVTRITREAIANAARHGGASQVVASLTASTDGVTLRVIDDGCGIEADGQARAIEGFGLRSIRERANALGGYLQIRRARRGGTELEVKLP